MSGWSTICTYEVGSKIIGACLLCHAVFVDGKNIEQLHVQTDKNCTHTTSPVDRREA